jgi:hypothetical protein
MAYPRSRHGPVFNCRWSVIPPFRDPIFSDYRLRSDLATYWAYKGRSTALAFCLLFVIHVQRRYADDCQLAVVECRWADEENCGGCFLKFGVFG